MFVGGCIVLVSSKGWALFSHKLHGSVWLLSGIWTLLVPVWSWNTNVINKNNLKNEESCWEITLDCHAHCTVPSMCGCGGSFCCVLQAFIILNHLFNLSLLPVLQEAVQSPTGADSTACRVYLYQLCRKKCCFSRWMAFSMRRKGDVGEEESERTCRWLSRPSADSSTRIGYQPVGF